MANNPAFELEKEIASSLRGIDFPADRNRIVQQARDNGASQEAVSQLERIREGEFGNVAEVMDATNESAQ